MTEPLIIARAGTNDLALLPALANRHGCITGATGTGKTISLQVMAEHFSRIGVPVFLAPTKPTLSGRIDPPTVAKRSLRIPLTNTGTVHAMVDNVVIRGMSAPDEVAFEDSLRGWYVLAGQTRTWQYDLKAAQCRSVKFVEIEVYADERQLTTKLDVPAAACNP
jgi:hypothetical protein